MQRGRCSLCGGKLVNNRCQLCGLNNSVNEKERQYERQGERQGYIEEEENAKTPVERSSVPKKSVKVQRENHHTYGKQVQVPAVKKKSVGKNGLAKFISVITVIFMVFSFGASIWPDVKQSVFEFAGISTEEEGDYYEETDPYAYVTRQISKEGSEFSGFLGPGFYQVGVHLPEGVYEISLEDGYGSFTIQDEENVIFDYSLFGDDMEMEDEVTTKDDVRLYNGAKLQIGDGVVLKFQTSNAQPLEQQFVENPLKATIEVNGEYIVGEGVIPEGIYDIRIEEEYADVEIQYPSGDNEYIWLERLTHQNGNIVYEEEGCKNVVLPEGTNVVFQGEGIFLEPCEDYYFVDFDTY